MIDKISEEVAEVREAIASKNADQLEREIGDLLLAIANLSRKLEVEPEAALRQATAKFLVRFRAVEQAFEARGQQLANQTLDDLEAEWQRAKKLA